MPASGMFGTIGRVFRQCGRGISFPSVCRERKMPGYSFLDFGDFSAGSGAGIYWTAYYIVVNELELAGQRGFQTLKIAVAIVLSILLVFELPQGIFRVRFRKEKKTI